MTTSRKLHIVWANGTTYCGRPAGEGALLSPDEAPDRAAICARCLESYRRAYPASSIYNTTGLGGA